MQDPEEAVADDTNDVLSKASLCQDQEEDIPIEPPPGTRAEITQQA